MRRLEEVLHDLAEQDERLPTSELITRIERRLSGESDFPVVVIDGRSEMDAHKNTRQTQRRRWAPALVAAGAALLVLLVVGLPILFLNGDEPIVADELTTTVASTTVTPAVVVPFPPSWLAVLEVPLSEAVPGFTDTIVMMTPWNGSGVMRWRPTEPMTELLLSSDHSDSQAIGFDASGSWFGRILANGGLMVEAVPTAPSESAQGEIVGSHLGDHAVWHDTESGRLAWLECPNSFEGPASLFTLEVSDPSAGPVSVRSFEQGCMEYIDESDGPVMSLERWTNSGVWLRIVDYNNHTFDMILVDTDGTEISKGPGESFSGQGPDGTSIWVGDPSYLLSPDGQHRSPVPGLADDQWLSAAWWSPDGTRLALEVPDPHDGYFAVLRIVDAASGEIITESEEPNLGGIAEVAWSTDNRFFLYVFVESEFKNRTLVFHDTASNTTTPVALSEEVWDIQVRSLDRSQ